MFFAVLAIASLLLLIVLFASVKVKVSFENTAVIVEVYILGILIFKRNFKKGNAAAKQEKDVEKNVKRFEYGLSAIGKRIKLFCKVSKYTLRIIKKYVSIASVNAEFTIGTGNAATTAVSTGVIWASAYNLLGIIGRIAYIDNHNLRVNPDYTNTVFNLKGECIIKSRLVYIIFISLKIKTLMGKEEDK